MERKYGYIPSPKDLRDYKINKIHKAEALPSRFIVKHSQIKDQGAVNSCVAHAISEILETHDQINYSTGWIYGYRPQGYYKGEGMVTSQALKTVNRKGYINNSTFNHNEEVPKAIELVDKDLDNLLFIAEHKKVNSYARLNSIGEIKRAIYSTKKPVLVAINVGTNGIELDDNYVAHIPDSTDGGHQLVCYGWIEEGLLIQNSWGSNWGNNGTFVLPYEYPIQEAWVINFSGETKDSQIQVLKPNLFFWRSVIQYFIKLFRKLFKK